jgi:hypothetical protein
MLASPKGYPALCACVVPTSAQSLVVVLVRIELAQARIADPKKVRDFV